MTYLADTNIFLEVLLNQTKKETCKRFLNDNSGSICISDFSLHSIGVILFRYGNEKLFEKSIDDITANTLLLSLSRTSYKQIAEIKHLYKLDFDDSYQFAVAKEYKLTLATMDKDFEKVKGKLKLEMI